MPRGVFEWTFQNNGSALSHYTWARPQVPLDLFFPRLGLTVLLGLAGVVGGGGLKIVRGSTKLLSQGH